MPLSDTHRERLRKVKPAYSMSDSVYERIADGIISGSFEPGAILSLRALASELGTSAMPIRDAMRRLLSDGAVVLNPNRTFQIVKLTAKELDEIREIRIDLEGMATRRAAQRIDREGLSRLKYIQERMEEYEGVDLKRFLLWNRDFHFLVYEFSDMPNLLRILETLWMKYGPTLNYFMSRVSQMKGAAYHREIIKALESGDGDTAARYIQKDIEDGASSIRPYLS